MCKMTIYTEKILRSWSIISQCCDSMHYVVKCASACTQMYEVEHYHCSRGCRICYCIKSIFFEHQVDRTYVVHVEETC